MSHCLPGFAVEPLQQTLQQNRALHRSTTQAVRHAADVELYSSTALSSALYLYSALHSTSSTPSLRWGDAAVPALAPIWRSPFRHTASPLPDTPAAASVHPLVAPRRARRTPGSRASEGKAGGYRRTRARVLYTRPRGGPRTPTRVSHLSFTPIFSTNPNLLVPLFTCIKKCS